MRFRLSELAVFSALLLLCACEFIDQSTADGGGDRGDAGGTEGSGAGGGDTVEELCGDLAPGFVCLTGRVKDRSGDGKADVEISVLGQAETKRRTNAKGAFGVKVDTGRSPTVVGGEKAQASSEAMAKDEYTIIFHQRAEKKGRAVQATLKDQRASKKSTGGTIQDLGDVEILATGNIAGTVTLAGQIDHTGIQVYLPGTSYLATTANDGRFVMSDVPPGLFPYFRAERDGYSPGLVPAIDVPSDDTLTLPGLDLGPSTGSKGGFEFSGVVRDAEGTYTTNRTVGMTILATDDAVLMMLSESNVFDGADWQPLQTNTSYTFSSAGQRTLYLKLVNATGLESSPVTRTITIDIDPRVAVVSPKAVTASSAPLLDWSEARLPNATYVVQLSADASFSDLLIDDAGVTDSEYAVTTALAADRTYYLRVAIEGPDEAFSWSDVVAFAVDFGNVTLLAPQGAQSLSGPVLDWSDAPISGASYRVQIAGDDSFSDPVIDVDGLTSSEYTVTTTLTPGMTYYWRVSVQDGNGVVAAFRGPQSFSVDLDVVSIQRSSAP